ncbi:MAG: hypothetical protein RLN81_16845, partial [Balneolaceae bacterium]
NHAFFSSLTEGASIGYKLFKTGESEPNDWNIYTDSELIPLTSGETVKVQAHRIGYKPSDIISHTKK